MKPLDIDNALTQLIYLARYTYNKGFTSSKGGNISYRLSKNIMIIKKSGVALRNLRPRDLIIVRNFRSRNKVNNASIDYLIHKEIYLNTPARIVLHAHPTNIIKYTLKIETAKIIPIDLEGKYYLNDGAPVVKGTHDTVFKEIGIKSRKYRIIVEKGHGIYVWGEDINEIINNLELIREITYLLL